MAEDVLDDIIAKKSKNRQEIEDLLKQKGYVIEKISVMNMDSGAIQYFDSYPDAIEFLKGKKGRWYIATRGIRRSNIKKSF
ncbi:MAG: hypothetical protein ACE14P_11295 [Methanotrichaceae archaeon]